MSRVLLSLFLSAPPLGTRRGCHHGFWDVTRSMFHRRIRPRVFLCVRVRVAKDNNKTITIIIQIIDIGISALENHIELVEGYVELALKLSLMGWGSVNQMTDQTRQDI